MPIVMFSLTATAKKNWSINDDCFYNIGNLSEICEVNKSTEIDHMLSWSAVYAMMTGRQDEIKTI